MALTSSLVNTTEREPPISLEPTPNKVTLICSGESSANSRSLAIRHCSINCDKSAADKRFSASPRRLSTRCAKAKSILSPPNIRWSPTPIRVNLGSCSPCSILISVKSVVPPPTSQTSSKCTLANACLIVPALRINQS